MVIFLTKRIKLVQTTPILRVLEQGTAIQGWTRDAGSMRRLRSPSGSNFGIHQSLDEDAAHNRARLKSHLPPTDRAYQSVAAPVASRAASD
jgi:hypothetical protein